MDWITISQTSGEGDGVFTLAVQPYGLLTDRTAYIEVKGISKTALLTITQTALDLTSVEDSNEWFWVRLYEDGTISGLPSFISYSFDHQNWYKFESSLDVPSGVKTYFKNDTGDFLDKATINFNKDGDVGGDLSSLSDMRERAFYGLFKNNIHLINANELILPWSSLDSYCCCDMFYNCTNLTTAPELPAITLEESCYSGMFMNCSNLITAPTLPSTTLAVYCYSSMFYNCTNLTTAPELPATTLYNFSYDTMFYGCHSLTDLPTIHASDLGSYGAYRMFEDCTGFTSITIPSHITILGQGMFYGCSNLSTIYCDAEVAPSTQYKPFIDVAYNGKLFIPFGSDYSNWLSAPGNLGDVYRWVDVNNAPLPKADNRIYYTGTLTIDNSVIYGTNAVYVGNGVAENDVNYIEYDRPITEVRAFKNVDGLIRLSLPSSLLYINEEFCLEASSLVEVDFGGNEIYIGKTAFSLCEDLRIYELPQTIAYLGACAMGGRGAYINTMGADTINLGADLTFVSGGVFNGSNNTKVVNFWGEVPPTFGTVYNQGEFGSFEYMQNAEYHIPIGTKTAYETAVAPYTLLGLSFDFIDDLEARPKTDYGETQILTGTSINVIPTHKTGHIGYWDGDTDTLTFYEYGGVENHTNSTITTTDDINGLSYIFDVLGNGVTISNIDLSGVRYGSGDYRFTYVSTFDGFYTETCKAIDYLGDNISYYGRDSRGNRVYKTESSTIANNYIRVIQTGTDKFGSICTLTTEISDYKDAYPTISVNWS